MRRVQHITHIITRNAQEMFFRQWWIKSSHGTSSNNNIVEFDLKVSFSIIQPSDDNMTKSSYEAFSNNDMIKLDRVASSNNNTIKSGHNTTPMI